MKKEDGFMQQLIIKIVNNVQIVINNLHIRYEDQITDPKHPFAVGFTLEEIRLRSTDEHWNEKEFINMEIANPYKIVKLRNFAFYWDNFKDNSSFLKYSSIEEMANQFRGLVRSYTYYYD
jgi:vacuolar protein sorting-associated protein 13A/C